MKINRKDPIELVKVALLMANNGYVALARPFIRRDSGKKTIIFFGHTLNGNLKSFYNYLSEFQEYDVYFLSIDNRYLSRLANEGQDGNKLLSAFNYRSLLKLSKADAFISSHGPQVWKFLPVISSIKFIDAWHGIPYKGFDKKDFNQLKHYDQVWVSSERLKKIHIEKYGLKKSQLKVTGYGRVDQLIDGSLSKEALINKYKLPKAKKYVLLAPTWQQDDKSRSILPFGTDKSHFFKKLDDLASKNHTHLIFRTHLNTGTEIQVGGLSNTSFMPYMRYENAEEFLFLSDILVTDWSSIAFDYLPLDRPTIFLDVPAPFKKGFSLGPEFRFGRIVSNFKNLESALNQYLANPDEYMSEYKDIIQKTKEVAYGDTLDGKSNERYLEAMNEAIKR